MRIKRKQLAIGLQFMNVDSNQLECIHFKCDSTNYFSFSFSLFLCAIDNIVRKIDVAPNTASIRIFYSHGQCTTLRIRNVRLSAGFVFIFVARC